MKNTCSGTFSYPTNHGKYASMGSSTNPKPIDKFVDIEAITCDKKRRVFVTRTSRKRNMSLDNIMVINTEETLLDVKKAKVSEFLGEGVAISHATSDREIKYER
jgi:hypothetical protein